jgi:uncharacterized protein (TIGR03086 family)
MQTTSLDLAPQAAEVARVIAGVRDDQLTDPTPCAGTPVAAILDHFDGLTVAFRKAAEKAELAGGPSADAAHLPADWRTRLPAQLDALVAAWGEPAAWEGMTDIAGMRMPAGAAGVVAANEVLVHGWDLAVATGQDAEADPELAEPVLAAMQRFLPAEPRGGRIPFAAPVPPRAGAGPTERLANWCGRAMGHR